MTDAYTQMMTLAQQGFYCSQIIMIMALELKVKENPDLIRAMGGLAGGMGFTGGTCGCLTGGVCMLGLFTAKGDANIPEDSNGRIMVKELVAWFEKEIGGLYGSSNCRDILQNDPVNKLKRCPGIIEKTWDKAIEILTDYGYEF
jgi:C_GCAxxG_C_C family probable redox protein